MPSFEFRRLPHFDNTELFSSENECAYFPFHFHDFYCVSLITNGTEMLKNTEQDFIAPAGTISITQAGEVHRNHSLSETGYSYKTIYINPDVLRHFNGGRVDALERVIHNKALYQSFLQAFGKSDVRELESAIEGLARHAVRPYEKNKWTGGFSRIDDIIESYPNKPIDTDWLCRQFCMSKFHFIRAFKNAKGITPQTYIMLYRLGKTRKMLLEGAPLAEIAYSHGFYDPSHFTHSFKKYFGVSPSKYLQA